jgi:integrase
MSRASSAGQLRVVPGAGAALEAAYAMDTWDANQLGIGARRGRDTAHFGVISQQWLRDTVKAWCRFRLATGSAFSTIVSAAECFRRFSIFLVEVHSEIVGVGGLTRAVIEDYLSWLTGAPLAVDTRSLSATFVKGFLDWGHRYGSLPGLRADAVLYEEDVARPPDALPLFVPEFVMAQLESEEALDRLPSQPSCRNLVVVLMETGLRGGDACELPFNPVIEDSVGWPCLRFANSKVASEQLIPLSEKAAAAIRSQQDYVTRTWPTGSPWLFPGIMNNPDGGPAGAGTTTGVGGDWWRRAHPARRQRSLQ